MADDEGDDGIAFDPTFATGGPRRSTFTPPTGGIPVSPARPDEHDDDALADALAADLTRLNPGAVPSPAANASGAAPLPAASVPPAVSVLPAAPPSVAPDRAAPAPWTSFPAPDPTQAVQLPDPPERPVRRSRPDDQLLNDFADDATRAPSATLDLIEKLQAELALREREAREFSDWQNTMRERGERVPSASAQPEPVQPAPSIPPESPPTAWFPYPKHPAPPAGSDAAEAQAPSVPPWQQPLPAWSPPQPDARVVNLAAEPVQQLPAPPLPAWEVPAPGPNWAPGPEYGAEALPTSEPIAPELPAPDPVVFAPVASEPVAVEPVFSDPARPAWEPQPWDRQPSDRQTSDRQMHDRQMYEADLGGDEPEIEPKIEIEPEIEPEPEPPALIEPGRFLGRDWAAPTGPPLAPAAGDTLEGPTLDAATVASAVAAAAVDSAPEAIFIEPMPLTAGAAVPTDTGSIAVVEQVYDEELPDDVDETDRAVVGLGPVSVDTAGIAVVTGAVHPPSGPISTVRVPEDEVVLSTGEFAPLKVFSLEESGLEPTPIDQRVGRAARLFWLWFASNSSVISLGLGAAVFAAGMSLRQSVVSVLAGVALSFIPLGLTTLAGKRSGQPTMVVSRATFGLIGNILPAILALLTRVFWGAVLLWLLASSVAVVLLGAALDGGLGDRQLLLISLAVAFLVALLVAFAGYPLFARIQLILSVISGILVVGLIAITAKYIDIPTALTTPDGPWVLTVTGTVLVFSFVGLVWANSGADLARYQRPTSSGAGSMLWATVGTTLPTFLLIAYGALLAASDRGIATGLLASPLDTLSLMLPSWYPVPLLLATGLSLLSGVILTLYSGGFALQAIGVRLRRQWSIVIVAVLLGGLALVFAFGVTGGINELFRDAATTLAVPTAAWAGIFAAETMIRNRRFESQSLLVRGGIYADVRWLNVIALVVIGAVGFGLTSATIGWLGWQGYGFALLGVPLDSDLGRSDVGVLVALGLGLLVPLVAGVPAIRKQEAPRPDL